MLAFVDPASYEGLGIERDCSPGPSTTRTIGQTIVLLGKMQESVDRLIENPSGPWDTIVDIGFIACALCTAASGHPTQLASAREMLDLLLGTSTMSAPEKELAGQYEGTPTAWDTALQTAWPSLLFFRLCLRCASRI
jgi:hypothetical protein